MKTSGLLGLLLCFTLQTSAQIFSKEFGDINDTVQISNILITKDSNIAVFARCARNPHDELLFIKLDTLGDTLMTKRYSNANNVIVVSVEQSNLDSSFYVMTETDSGSSIVNLDKNGLIIWQKNYFLTDTVMEFRKLKLVDEDSLFVLCRSAYKSYLLKMDIQGNIVKEIFFGSDALHSSYNSPEIVNFIVDRNHNIICTGMEGSTYPGNIYQSTLLVKLNSNGDILWTFCNALAYEVYTEVEESSAGEYWIISKYWWMGAESASINIVDTNGTYLCSIYGPGDVIDYHSAYSLADSNLVFTGRVNGNRAFRMEVNASRTIINYKIGNAQIATEAVLNGDRAIFGSSHTLAMVDTHYGNCFLEDSIVLNPDCQPWIWADNSYLEIVQGTNQFLSTSTPWNCSSGITMDNGCISLGTEQLEMKEYLLFPNPATGEVKFQQEDLPFGALFTLYDAHSNLMVKVSNPTTKTILFNADYFSSGMYFYNFVTSSGSLYSGKVIILH